MYLTKVGQLRQINHIVPCVKLIFYDSMLSTLPTLKRE